MSTVFLCSTYRNWRSVIALNWENDMRSAAHLFCSISSYVSSTSRFYLSKLAFCNFIQLEKWPAECGASFLFLYSKTLSSTSMFYHLKFAFCKFIQLEKWSVERGASFMFLIQIRESDWGSASRGVQVGSPNLGIRIRIRESESADPLWVTACRAVNLVSL